MKSGHIIDTASRARQFTQFFQQCQREKNIGMQTEAKQKDEKFLSLIRAGNANPGRILSTAEITKRLRKINPSLLVMQSIAYPEQGAIYIYDGKSNLDDLNETYRGLRMVAAMAWGMVPENTCGTITTDDKGVEVGRISRKGWRTTLCQLIETRLISLTAAEKAFGSGGKNWHQRFW